MLRVALMTEYKKLDTVPFLAFCLEPCTLGPFLSIKQFYKLLKKLIVFTTQIFAANKPYLHT